jgi:hypothetical protein
MADQRAYTFIRARIDRYWVKLAEEEIQPAAESLRPGIKYTIDIPKTSTVEERQYRQGGCNIHIPITFDDGVQWLARVHYSANIVPSGASSRIRTSEVAVMQTARSLAPGLIPPIHIAGTQNGKLPSMALLTSPST